MIGDVSLAMSPVRYARNGDLQIAYRTRGTGPALVMFAGTLSEIVLAELRLSAWLVERHAQFASVVLIDPPGTGASDPLDHEPTPHEQAADILAVARSRAHPPGVRTGGPRRHRRGGRARGDGARADRGPRRRQRLGAAAGRRGQPVGHRRAAERRRDRAPPRAVRIRVVRLDVQPEPPERPRGPGAVRRGAAARVEPFAGGAAHGDGPALRRARPAARGRGADGGDAQPREHGDPRRARARHGRAHPGGAAGS